MAPTAGTIIHWLQHHRQHPYNDKGESTAGIEIDTMLAAYNKWAAGRCVLTRDSVVTEASFRKLMEFTRTL